MEGKKVLSQLSPYKQGMQMEDVKRKYNLSRIIKLSSNENPFGCSNKVKEDLPAFLDHLEIYPDGHATELRSALAKKLGVKEEEIVFGSGSDEIVQIICRAFLYPGANTVMASPTFPQYKHNALIEGAGIKEIPLKSGYHDMEKMLAAIDDNTKIVWLCTPNNPTGSTISREELYVFLEKCPKNVLVAIDEAYYEFLDASLDPHTIDKLPEHHNLIVLRTFSKAYGLAGFRVGYGIGHEKLIGRLNIARGPFNTSSIAQKAALIALSDDQFINKTVARNKKIKQSFEQFLDEIDWKYYDSQTNFLLIETPLSGNEMFEQLLKHGYIVRPGEAIGSPGTIRVTIGTENDMDDLKDVWRRINEEI